MKEIGNMFLVHDKSNLCIYKCNTAKASSTTSSLSISPQESGNGEMLHSFSLEAAWTLGRSARQFSRSLDNLIAIVDDRAGLSIINPKSGLAGLTLDTLRGVGKFKNLYTPLGSRNIKHLQWSESGVYLVVCFNLGNYSKESGISVEDNMHIWDITTKSIVGTFSTRRLSPDQWPIIKWIGKSDNFVYCYGHMIAIYTISCADSASLKSIKMLHSIPMPRVFSVEVGVDEQGSIALSAFTTADLCNSTPGSLQITQISSVFESQHIVIDSCSGGLFTNTFELATADSAEMLWSPSGRFLLVLASSTVDLAGERYGSTTNCLLFTSDGENKYQVNTRTAHDARWNPTRDEFIIMQGNMPCDITLYDANGPTILFDFPKLYRNTIKWSKMGNMVALCGLGNLAGEVCFWYKDGTELERVVQFKEPCTVNAEWSLDSRYFMAACTFPRMKVDNFVKIFNTEGDLLEHCKFDECYNSCWVDNGPIGEFIRPRVKKTTLRKAIYKPKVNAKPEESFISDTVSPKPVSSMSPAAVPFYKTLFSSVHGDVCDPAVSLLDVFQHAFCLGKQREETITNRVQSFANNCSLQQSNTQQSIALIHQHYKMATQGERLTKAQTTTRQPNSSHHIQQQLPPSQEQSTTSLSMLMKLKNTLPQERPKQLQQQNNDEVDLFHMLLSARNKSANRPKSN